MSTAHTRMKNTLCIAVNSGSISKSRIYRKSTCMTCTYGVCTRCILRRAPFNLIRLLYIDSLLINVGFGYSLEKSSLVRDMSAIACVSRALD